MAKTLRSFRPIADERSRILILGSMPGPVALERKEYYGFPGNHFWRVIAAVLDVPLPERYAGRIAMLKEHRIALWDTIRSCTRTGASDSSIRCVVPNDIPRLLKKYPGIHTIFLNGSTAETLYRRHFGERLRLAAHRLPSTSPAHASLSAAKKLKAWSVIRQFLANRNPWC